ncbi:MAG: CoA transferase, partial [Ignavibacteriae bacterium]|nr:CoA transferase [Ignavibacteriota bacterium]
MKKRNNQKAPLSGIRILDLTRILSGPFCTMKLGDMGAEVIKIEQPGKGDDTRSWGPPFVKGESAYFLSVNRNKKSVTLDLKAKEGKEILTKLIKSCDVLVENFRAGVMENLGFSYAKVKKLNPRLVYCSISGYGQTSSRSHQPSYDLIVQGESGLMDVTGFPDGAPTKAGISLADVTAGTLAFEGILLALFQRERTGKGQQVDISLLDGLLSLFAYQSQIALSSDRKVTRKGNRHPTITPYETFGTKDGFINVAVGSETHWKNFCTAIKRIDLIKHEQFATNSKRVENREALEKILVPIMKS